MDAAGDPLPEHAVSRLGSERFVTSYDVRSLAFSYDGSVLAGDISSAYLWDSKTGKQLLHVRESGGRVAVSPDACWLVCGDFHVPVRVWNVKTKQAADVQFPKDAAGYGFSPDGKTLAVALHRKMDVYLYDVGNWQLKEKLAAQLRPSSATRSHSAPTDGCWPSAIRPSARSSRTGTSGRRQEERFRCGTSKRRN